MLHPIECAQEHFLSVLNIYDSSSFKSSFLTLLVLSCFLVISKYFYILQLKLLAKKLAAVLTVFTYIRGENRFEFRSNHLLL